MGLTNYGLTDIGQGKGFITNFQVQYESTLPNQAQVIANSNALLARLWEKDREDWLKAGTDPRPPVFILVCKNTRTAKVIYGGLANNQGPTGIPPARIEGFRNKDGQLNTIRVDSKVVHERIQAKPRTPGYRLTTVGPWKFSRRTFIPT